MNILKITYVLSHVLMSSVIVSSYSLNSLSYSSRLSSKLFKLVPSNPIKYVVSN